MLRWVSGDLPKPHSRHIVEEGAEDDHEDSETTRRVFKEYGDSRVTLPVRIGCLTPAELPPAQDAAAGGGLRRFLRPPKGLAKAVPRASAGANSAGVTRTGKDKVLGKQRRLSQVLRRVDIWAAPVETGPSAPATGQSRASGEEPEGEPWGKDEVMEITFHHKLEKAKDEDEYAGQVLNKMLRNCVLRWLSCPPGKGLQTEAWLYSLTAPRRSPGVLLN